MKLGLATPGLGFQGGLERHAHDLARSLIERGHTVRLLHGPGRGRDAAGFSAAFSSVSPLVAPGALSDLDLVWVEKVASASELALYGNLPLILGVHDHDLTCVRTSRMLAVGRSPCLRAPGTTCVAHGCVIVRDRAPGQLPLRLANPFTLRERIFELSRRAPLVACSAFLASTLIDAGAIPERVRHLHPIPAEDTRPLVPRPREPRLLVAGQLVHGKGVDLAIDAMALLPAQIELEIAGDGRSRHALESRAAALGLGARVKFLGYVAPEQMPALYDRASVVVVPSRWPEPFGLIGIEAMRRARPVAAAMHGGIPEWLPHGRGGEGFHPDDARDLARAAQTLLNDPAAGDRAREETLVRFSHARTLDAVEALLRQAASGWPTEKARASA